MSKNPSFFVRLINNTSLVSQILIGMVGGILLATFMPSAAKTAGLMGTLFVGALKAVAPVLVLLLVTASIAGHKQGQKTSIRPLLVLYLFGTFCAAVVAVVASFAFPSTLHLSTQSTDIVPPGGITEVLNTLLFSVVSNPVKALLEGNYIGILAWAIALGLTLRHASETTKILVGDLSHAVSSIVKGVIRCAPLGIMGLVASTFAETGFSALLSYAHLLPKK